MTTQSEASFDFSQLPLLMDTIPVGITVVDLNGNIQFYNKYSSHILDRKPEYIGIDIRECHKKQASIDKIDHMLDAFQKGRHDEFGYETIRDGKHIVVKFSPLVVEGKISACVQTVILK
jgi:DUF438 domain-containing protein